MAPPARGRSLPKASFSPHFSKLKTLTYTDTLRPGAVVPAMHFIRTLSWNASGTFIATGAADRTLRIWNPDKPNVRHSTELKGLGGPVERVQFHPINDNELASCSADGAIRFWDVRSKASVGEYKVNGEPFTITWRPDGEEIVVGTKDNRLIQLDRSTLTPISEHQQPIVTNHSVFDWSGKHLFLTNGDGRVKVLRYPSFENPITLTGHTSLCYALSMSPSGETLAVGGSDALVSLWDTQEWICVRTLNLVENPVKSVDFSFDGSYVVAGADDEKKMQIAHVETGEIVHTQDLTKSASQVAWHPYRYVLAYSAESQGLKIIGNKKKFKKLHRPLCLPITQDRRPDENMNIDGPFNPSSLFSAKGLVVVITGGGSGLGIAIAAALLQNGASKIYLLGRRKNVLDDAINTLQSSPSAPEDAASKLTAIQADVANQDSVSAAAAQIKKEVGFVDVLLNNAGVIGPKNAAAINQADSIEQLQAAFLDGYDEWGTTFAVNTQSLVGVTAAFLPLLEAANTRRGFAPGKVTGAGVARKQDRSKLKELGLDEDDDRLSHVISVASVASFMRFSASGLAYNATKSAAVQVGKILSTHLAQWGIRSNVIAPGPYPSEMNQQGANKQYGTDELPQGRQGNANDIAALALFLVGKSGAYINGVVQLSDGGRVGVNAATY
ncbi:WD40 repeat-like protein [Aaosphaeria arxii CBS 175.79]|uniref:WD40 repeat-like protein n=1 Tax=Aaosphaeria arxii CBS 175.79 TaxID=1450172 RepID=A0A6A5Y081_9PLEO|nr:WD40 repeat-like protein [Aaosphaeria arxii CBS 175.79]KAF2018862.1 WD40 repeat-like protein [Aaosphaeria arxii CBS 175.79]